ncbi:MAG: hypothetical protein JOZ89_06100, partial [Gammaproteobacteria bacterium]|nr:hypothetical protein [Gammaproteobacteria bacterium]
IHPEGRTEFSVAGRTIPATHYVVRTTLHGVAGAMASVLGKQPPDAQFWIVGGRAPAFVKAITPLYEGGPIWTIELASATSRDDPPREADRSHSQ